MVSLKAKVPRSFPKRRTRARNRNDFLQINLVWDDIDQYPMFSCHGPLYHGPSMMEDPIVAIFGSAQSGPRMLHGLWTYPNISRGSQASRVLRDPMNTTPSTYRCFLPVLCRGLTLQRNPPGCGHLNSGVRTHGDWN